ncbi:unnamed protein product [Gongylonema pulchrum]|uniref:J domain-containing protein n=1 Tax=Gongylonema pulchrum TaxID=637853 RepID=A0A183DQQ4_9BILA|nr:unnamed protein product [Gongylonema pulchrum]
MMSSADISNPFIMLFMASFLHGIAEPAAERCAGRGGIGCRTTIVDSSVMMGAALLVTVSFCVAYLHCFKFLGVLDVTGEKMASGKPLLDFDPYEILYLERGCTDAEIVKAFRRAALKWHPDKNPDRIQTAQDMFLKISKAFALLSDVTARAAYDHVLAAKAAREAYVQQRQRNENEKQNASRFGSFGFQIERLRREGSKLLQRERENVEREVHRDTSTKQGCANDSPFTRYKLRWEREVSERDYCEEDIRQLFSKVCLSVLQFEQRGAVVSKVINLFACLRVC